MRESFEDWQTLGRDLIARGLGAPMLIVADGAPGLTKAIEQCWPASDRQRCCVHRARNLYAKLPDRERERRECRRNRVSVAERTGHAFIDFHSSRSEFLFLFQRGAKRPPDRRAARGVAGVAGRSWVG
jgi:hypothetical protein